MMLSTGLAGCGDSVIPADAKAEAWRPVWGDAATAPIRPGVQIGPSNCTSGFLFVDPVAERYYLSTAGHCTGASQPGIGSRITVDPLGEIGTVVFESNPDTVNDEGLAAEPRLDFSLIELDPGFNFQAHPQVFGLDGAPTVVGPTGLLYCADVMPGDTFTWHGFGTGYGSAEQTRRREGTLRGCTSEGEAFFGPGPAAPGDSGAAALHRDSGAALGILTGYNGEVVGESFGYIFDGLAEGGFGDVALALVDGGFQGR